MNKLIIGSLVGGVLLFAWQFLSWAALNIHNDTAQHTPKQDTILAFLETQIEPGFYYLPTAPQGASSEEQQKIMTESVGKPWAQISYHSSMSGAMGMNMLRGLLVDVVVALLLCWLILQNKDRTFKDSILLSLAVGLIGYLFGPYTNAIWFENPTMSDLLDAIVGFGLLGVWLGWYLKKQI